MSQLKSMTGFGVFETSLADAVISVQIRSWNRKGSDISIQLPSGFREMEGAFREWLQTRVQRGSLQVHVEWKGPGQNSQVFDTTAWQGLVASVEDASQMAGVSSKELLLAVASSWSHALGCFHSTQNQDMENIQKQFMLTLEKAFEQWESFRIHEGASLSLALEILLDEIHRILSLLHKASSLIATKLMEKLLKRLEMLGVYQESDPMRWQMEVALLAERCDVREEMDRLQMHVLHFRNCLKEGPFPVGRRLDFLSQEMLREINTLMNKCQDFGVSQLGVDLKVALDRLREQLQNVE
jgi:uncharacterized protein (TIGR00255 family)